MLKWSIELCSLYISFAPQAAIKAQALADFLIEHSFTDVSIEEEKLSSHKECDAWIMMVDDVVNSNGVGIRITLTLPNQ